MLARVFQCSLPRVFSAAWYPYRVDREAIVSAMHMYMPSVYNESCQQIALLHGEPVAFTSYDLFRCAVIFLVTSALIAGNLSLALAVNSKYCVNVLQFQVGPSSRFSVRLIDFSNSFGITADRQGAYSRRSLLITWQLAFWSPLGTSIPV